VRTTIAIANRELRAYFLTPGGYIIIALFLLAAGLVFFVFSFRSGEIASLRTVFGIGTWLLTFIAPAVTMRLFSEELRMGSMELLMTAPVREHEVVLGKFLGALGLLVLMLLPTVLFIIALELYGRPDYGEMTAGYLGMLLAGTAYLASGLFASTITNSQPVAFLVALFFWLTVGIGTEALPAYLDDPWARIMLALSPARRLQDFTIGLIDTANVVYFLSVAALFLIASVVSVKARRWY
jgi:ABC-2 type transport system permease protein